MRQVNDRLFLLPAGYAPPEPVGLLSPRRASAVIQALAQEFDVVIMDSTPVLPVTDALVASRLVDATMLVVDTQTTKRKILHHAVERLPGVGSAHRPRPVRVAGDHLRLRVLVRVRENTVRSGGRTEAEGQSAG